MDYYHNGQIKKNKQGQKILSIVQKNAKKR